MSDKRRHRDHRRHGSAFDYDQDHPPADAWSRQPPARRPMEAAAPVDVVVKWFNAEKGFGFVTTADGTEAFLHINPLRAAGCAELPDGAHLKVRLGPGKKGPQVTEVLEVDTSNSVQPTRRPAASQQQGGTQSAESLVGSVKWYNQSKGFGFVAVGDGRKDVFVHARALERCGLSDLAEGQRVRMQVVEGQKGPEARSVEPLDE